MMMLILEIRGEHIGGFAYYFYVFYHSIIPQFVRKKFFSGTTLSKRQNVIRGLNNIS